MKNFINLEILKLAKNYNDSERYYYLNVLKQFAIVSFDNNGFLPNRFEINIVLPDLDIIKEVLKDLGYPHVRNISCYGSTVYITLY